MIKKFKLSQGAVELANNPNIIVENGLLSNSYFSTTYGLNELSIGKNALRIVLSPNVVPNAKLLVDIVDNNGNLIYYETMNYLPNDRSTIISVYIYDNTANGPATIYIGGRALRDIYTNTLLNYSEDSFSPDYLDIPNMLYIGQLNVNNNRINQSEIIYLRPPQASVTEITRTFKDPSTAVTPRLNVNSGSGQTLSQHVSNYSQNTNITTIGQLESTIVGAKTIVEKQFDTGRLLDPLISSDNKQGNEAKSIYIEDYNNLPVIVSDTKFFEKDMIGGTIVVNNIDTASLVPDGATILGQYLNGEYVQSNSYTASIIEVINSKNAIVNVPFQLYYTFDSVDINNLRRRGIANNVTIRSTRAFSGLTDFTASYIQRVSDALNTPSSQSYANFIVNNLDPATGTIYKIQTLYKPYGTFGNYIDLGYHELNSTNLLVDTSSLVPDPYEGQKELPIGEFVSQSVADNYWQLYQVNLGSGTSPTLEVSDTSNTKLIYGVTVTTGSKAFNDVLQTDQNASAVYITHDATINVTTDTQYTVKFNAFSTTNDIVKTSQYPKPVIDVYISGSSIETDLLRTTIDINNNVSNVTDKLYNTTTSETIQLGTFVGTIRATGLFLNNAFNFKATQNGNVKLLFIVRSGEWTLSDIELVTDYTLGFTPNYTNYKVQIPAVYRNTQLEFLLRYYNENGTIAPVKSRLSGVKFVGNNQFVAGNDNLLPGVLNLGTNNQGGVSLDGNNNTVSTYGYSGGEGWTMWSGSRNISGSLQSGSGFFFETGAPYNHYIKATVGGQIQISGSVVGATGGTTIDTGSFVTTSSFNSYTSSINSSISSINIFTGSIRDTNLGTTSGYPGGKAFTSPGDYSKPSGYQEFVVKAGSTGIPAESSGYLAYNVIGRRDIDGGYFATLSEESNIWFTYNLTASVYPTWTKIQTTNAFNAATGSFVTTSSFNTYTSSINSRTGSFVTTGSFNAYTASVHNSLNGKANLAGGNTFSGAQIINGSITISGSNAYISNTGNVNLPGGSTTTTVYQYEGTSYVGGLFNIHIQKSTTQFSLYNILVANDESLTNTTYNIIASASFGDEVNTNTTIIADTDGGTKTRIRITNDDSTDYKVRIFPTLISI